VSRHTLSGASKAERLAHRQARIPAGARLVPGPAGGAAYTYEVTRNDGATVPYALVFRGTAARAEWHHSYRSEAQRAEHIDQFHRSIRGSAEARATRRAERSAWTNPLTAGAILYTSWGYDQTNVEFFAVTRVSGRRTWIREIAAEYEATGDMTGRTWPALPMRYTGAETMHTARSTGRDGGAAIKINESRTAWLETAPGRKHSTSSYA
jgi:hypothetical protein